MFFAEEHSKEVPSMCTDTKSCLLLVRGAAVEPVESVMLAAAQPGLTLSVTDSLAELQVLLSQLVPTLVIWQCDAPEMSASLD